ncbi:MAG: primosomal protein N' [Bacteroidales bacterium]|nr:primosomal protein N' [Bacteroidales bacterium]
MDTVIQPNPPSLPLTESHPVHAALFAEIVFDRPLDHAYTYAVPETLREQIAVGKRVRAPFGRGDRSTDGFCVGVTEQMPDREVKSITEVLDEESLLDDPLLRLTRWMADYYLCGWGQVLHAVVPAGVRANAGTKSAVFVEAVPQAELPNPLPTVSPKQKQALDRLRAAGQPLEQSQLGRELGGTGAIAGLVSKGLVRKFTERVERNAATEPHAAAAEPTPQRPELVLSADQQAAWETIHAGLQTSGFHAYLLHGVTGSGKTEIYLRAIEEVIRQGKEAIVLVPEISLTPQTIERFSGPEHSVAVLHSHLTNAERGGHWRRIASGLAQIVVGARSAVFAPTRKLGLIVIDEEHENSFKQESIPRYHGRDVAVMRASLAGIPIILGSATPSLESWHNAAKKSYTLLELPTRVASRPMPTVKLVDLRHEPKTPGKHFAIGPTLEMAMRQTLKDNGQVILLLNRRGYSTHIHCPGCGHVAQCIHCDLALTFHRAKAALLCHYCGWESAPVLQCVQCGQDSVRYQGLGTEKLQVEIEGKFPDRVVQRMDSDTMSKPGSHRRVLDAFREGKIQILLGTQMIAKGLDFPNVTLVGVINADVGLHMPDFRAAERTFQLLAQVAGRAGRGDRNGLVMVQTFTPDHPCIALAAQHDYHSFARLELALRKEHAYPPYQRMARVIVRSENQAAAEAFAETLAGSFQQAVVHSTRRFPAAAPVRVLGPAECPVFKLKGYYRFHFQLQSDNSGLLHTVLREVLLVSKPPHGVEFQVDVDPYSML